MSKRFALRLPVQQESWGLRLAALGTPRLRLVWFYHAGGNSLGLVSWRRALPTDWEVLIPEYPGRGVFPADLSLRGISEIAAHFSARLPLSQDLCPLFLAGHSMGALVAFELARQLTAKPTHLSALLISAVKAPRYFSRERGRNQLSDERLLASIATFGGTPLELLDNDGYRAGLLRQLRADYSAINAYQYVPGPPLEVPILAFAGKRDTVAPADAVALWRHETALDFELRELAGGHFYYLDSPVDAAAAWVDAVNKVLQQDR